jgi:hypothetical protein
MFVIVDIGIDQMDIKRMKLNRSFLQIICHYLYYIFRRYIKYQKQLVDSFTLYDNGMKIEDSFIPYEYLVSATCDEMVLLAKREEDKIVPCDNLIRIKFSEKINLKVVESNLFYHLKYNDISLDVLNFKSIKLKPSSQKCD